MKYKIAFIEDDSLSLKYYEALGRVIKQDFRCLSSPITFLEKEDIYIYDLVITDLYLPEMDGYELCRKIKELRPTLPVVICSAAPLPRDRTIGNDCANEYLQKPFLKKHIEAVIERWCRK